LKKKRKKKPDTMDIYKDKQREEMLKKDEITAAENALMTGRNKELKKGKEGLWLEEEETKAVKLAQKEHQED
jgi:post-segregation antitoxin (ccd killing protein)